MARVPLLFLICMVYIKSSEQGKLDSFENGTPSKTSFINEDIPEECEHLGFCVTSKRYPVKLATKLIRELKEANITLDRDYKDSIENRYDEFSNEELCHSTEDIVAPLMIKDVNGSWYYMVNSKTDPIQEFHVRICSTKNAVRSDKCTTQLTLDSDYESQCVQKYMYRRTNVIKNGDVYPMFAKIPSCCACVATMEEF